ncbi:MAG: hypothetical protein ACKO3K_11395 [Cuspidothrix sp.]
MKIGNLLLRGWERSELERQKNERLIAQLKSFGIEPDVYRTYATSTAIANK